MAKAMHYPAYPQQAAVERAQPAQAVATAKAATRRMVKIGPLVLIACLVLAILAVLMVPMVVGGTASGSSPAATVSEAQPLTAVSYDSVQEAAAALNLPGQALAGIPEDVQVTAAAVVDDSYLELALAYGKNTYLYRAAAGSDDLSGMDYEAAAYTAVEELDSAAVGFTGVSEKKLTSAVWINGDYTYALVAENGVAAEEMRTLATAMA